MYNILICDDERDIVNALKIYLANPDYRLLEAHTGQEALDILDREFTAFLEGGSTAQDCAGQIQSRVSLYLAENAD